MQDKVELVSLIDAIEPVLSTVKDDEYWKQYTKFGGKFWFGIHLAILNEPYLSKILDGTKTVESRFSKNMIAPYKTVVSKDMLLLKRSSGPVVGFCAVVKPWFFCLHDVPLSRIKIEFGPRLGIEDPDAFWEGRKDASFATMMEIDHVVKIQPFNVVKNDRRPWVTIHVGSGRGLLAFT